MSDLAKLGASIGDFEQWIIDEQRREKAAKAKKKKRKRRARLTISREGR